MFFFVTVVFRNVLYCCIMYSITALRFDEKTKKWFADLEYMAEVFDENYEVILRLVKKSFEIKEIPDELRIPDIAPKHYKKVNSHCQIDEQGKLFLTNAKSMRGPIPIFGTPLVGKRYATQGDYDKFCMENPEDRPGLCDAFDWNAAVWKSFADFYKYRM